MIRSPLSWRTIVALPATLVAAATTLAQSPALGNGPQVTIDAGAVVGVQDTSTGVSLFRGIPYAAPPVGELRFRPPGAVAPWAGSRAATAPGAACTQFDSCADTYLELGPEIAARRGLRKAEYDVLDALARARSEVRP